MYYGLIDSPIGALMLAGDGEALCRIAFETEERWNRPDADWQRRDTLFIRAADQLRLVGDRIAGRPGSP